MNKWFAEVANLEEEMRDVWYRYSDENGPNPKFWWVYAAFEQVFEALEELRNELREE